MSLANDCTTVIVNPGENSCDITISATPSAELGNGTFNLTVTLSWTAAPAAANEIYIVVRNVNGSIVAEKQEPLPAGTQLVTNFNLPAPADNEIWDVTGAFVDNN